ncbi:hypothetical protein MVEG_10504 [Podila verticillata NRRL 6337]|nr:hypothetical protein MVEG_10504 [Podila verticillata NRRL 6337]
MAYTPKRIHLPKSLMGSFLLSLVVLCTFSPPTTHGLSLSNKNTYNNLWKRVQPSCGHSPYCNPDHPPLGELQPNSKKKRSLYSHINGDIDTPEQQQQIEAVIEFGKPADNSNKQDHGLDLDRFDTWEADEVEGDESEENNNEIRTLIEPHYPSIDLFDDDSVVVDDDHRFNKHTLEDHDLEDEAEEELDRLAQSGAQGQVWMVDEWEEELEGEMDELMEWIEEDHILNRPEDYPSPPLANKDKVLGSGRLRDRQRSFADETSRFQRLFSESWLF